VEEEVPTITSEVEMEVEEDEDVHVVPYWEEPGDEIVVSQMGAPSN
jgi:hypothetical protein